MSKIILCLVGPEYEDLEVWYPKLRLEEAGFTVPLAGMGDASYRGKHGYPAVMDGHVRDWDPGSLAGIIAPGGWAPDKLRRDRDVLDCVRQVHEAGKMIATICHGPWILISAGIVRGSPAHVHRRHPRRPGERRCDLGRRAVRHRRQYRQRTGTERPPRLRRCHAGGPRRRRLILTGRPC